MIVIIHSAGKSFSGLATYLAHDPDAKTDERVGWTHTLNLAFDDPKSAVDEMLWTYRDAELLKQEAGIRAGGRSTESPVKHFSLNWSPDDSPTREHMIETAEDFLRHMKWQDHQALLVAHDDKAHAHVHVMLNAIHPETGLCLDDGFERRRAQAWALEYEREQGNIRCENRLKEERERDGAPTRPAWMAFRAAEKSFEENEKSRAAAEGFPEKSWEYAEDWRTPEWQDLKKMQRDERLRFIAEGKLEFKEMRLGIYHEVREEFREAWGDYYSAAKKGADPEWLKETKATLVSQQKEVLEARRDEACAELRESRDAIYKDLLAEQREMRAGLRMRQTIGLESDVTEFFRADRRGPSPSLMPPGSERKEVEPNDDRDWSKPMPGNDGAGRSEDDGRIRSPTAIIGDIGVGLGMGLLAFFDNGAGAGRARKGNDSADLSQAHFNRAAEDARQGSGRAYEDEEERRMAEERARSRQ